jgi:peptidoglycan/xylan/chitin deacetylase (PgdA/CDA1 family)
MAIGEALGRRFAIRVDIDTVKGLVDGVPALLDILEEFGVRATFFASVGTDTAARAIFFSPRPRRHKAINPIRKFGLWKLMRSLWGLDFQSHGGEFRKIERGGHEIQLHCFNHLDWIRKIVGADRPEARVMIERGIEGFQKIFGRRPTAFASPGFLVTEAVLDAEEQLGFAYASDYHREGDCIPFVDGHRVLQIPVNAPLIEDLVAKGVGDDSIASTMGEVIGDNMLTVIYLHPSYEPRLKPQVLRSVLTGAVESAENVTLWEVFEKWNHSK